MALHPIIKYNLTTLLRAGAFGISDRPLQIMSAYKWHKLEELAIRLNIGGYINVGANLLKEDSAMPDGVCSSELEEVYSSADAHFFNRFKQKRFENICDLEPHDIAASMDTLRLLRLIVTIGNDITTSSLPLPGIITLGRFLRKDGDKVDFVKLETWIKKLGIVQIASLECAILIELFDFVPEEFPHIRRFYRNAIKHYDHIVETAFQSQSHFSSTSRMNIAMIETTSRHLGNFTTRITNIEE